MERELQEKLDRLLASPYGRTMLSEYAYLNAAALLIQFCEAAGNLARVPDWLADVLELGRESAEIFASLTDAGTLETDRKTMSVLLNRHGLHLAQTSARFRQALELHRPGLNWVQELTAEEPIARALPPEEPIAQLPPPRPSDRPSPAREPKAEFLPPSEMRVVGDVEAVP
ncbi:MAG TPA: hypothetical protein V6D46_02510 [Coleofasciculaceae cyanobacterium]